MERNRNKNIQNYNKNIHKNITNRNKNIQNHNKNIHKNITERMV